MTTASYLISLTASYQDVETTVTILNIAWSGAVIFGSNDKAMHIVPKGKKNIDREEMIKQLKAVPTIQSVEVVELSTPVKKGNSQPFDHCLQGLIWTQARSPTTI